MAAAGDVSQVRQETTGAPNYFFERSCGTAGSFNHIGCGFDLAREGSLWHNRGLPFVIYYGTQFAEHPLPQTSNMMSQAKELLQRGVG